MIKFYKNVDIKNSDLYLSFPTVGLAGSFASSLLINNHSFEEIGFFFSEKLAPYVFVNSLTQKLMYNGQIYYNSEKKITLIYFNNGINHVFKKSFNEELLNLCNQYLFKNIYVYGGINKKFSNDLELKNENVDVFYLTNSQIDAKKFNIKDFTVLVNEQEKKKPFEELKYIEQAGFGKHFIHFLIKQKKNIPFFYFFAYSNDIFDPLAGSAIYHKLTHLNGFKDEYKLSINKNLNMVKFLEESSKNLIVEPSWKLFLKE